MSTSDWIREGRKGRKLSQAELGQEVGASQVKVSQWETGKAAPSPEEMQRLAELLGAPGGLDQQPPLGLSMAEAPAPKERKARKAKADDAGEAGPAVLDYRHEAKRKNIPPAGLAAQGKVKEARKIEYAYNPHLPPVASTYFSVTPARTAGVHGPKDGPPATAGSRQSCRDDDRKPPPG